MKYGPTVRTLLLATCLGAGSIARAQGQSTVMPATAADEQEAVPADDDLVVTGSRIVRKNTDSPAPISVVTADQIRAAGSTQITDVINQLPALAITQTNQTSNLAGNAGVNALDLRGMGTQRTLVLVDGRRQVPAIPGTSAVDLSNIPSSLVERVEVVTGGASALYGADAVAGVANFILKKNFSGLEANSRLTGSTRNDMQAYSFDLLGGYNFGNDDRGNVTAYGFFENQPSSITGSDRPWTADGYPIYVRPNRNSRYTISDGNRNIYSADVAQVVLGGRLYSIDNDGSLRAPVLGPGGIVNVVPVDLTGGSQVLGTLLTDGGEYHGRYDGWYLSVPSQRFSSRVSTSYEFDDALKLFAVGSYADNSSQGAYAPLTAYGSDAVPADSPFITPAIRAAAGGTIPAGGLYFARRVLELGTPVTEYKRQLFQGTIGAEGKFSLLSHPWSYSAYVAQGKTTQKVRSVNATAYDRWYNGLDSTAGANGQAVCRSTLTDPANGCVAINPLVPLTPQMIDYVQYTSSWATSTLNQQVASAYITGGLFDLPGGPVQVVIGGEYRKERNDIGATPEFDPTSPAYDPTIGVTETALVGRYSVKEAYGELSLPLLANVPGFHLLSAEGALRFSDYSTAGNTTTYKLAGEWAPFRDIRFRATFGKAVRAPNIGELYTASSIGGLWVTDPCNTYNLQFRADKSQYTPANCAAIAPSDRATYWLYRDIISKGNLDLKPESAKTLTVGAVFEPRFVKGFSLSVDYYNIDLRNAIDAFGAQTLINKCVDQPTLTNIFCPLVTRDAGGNLLEVITQKLNLAQYLTRGIDIAAYYTTDLSDWGLGANAGRLSIDAAYTRLLKRQYTLDPQDPSTITEYRGVFGSPEWKGVVRTSYANRGFGATWTLRHFSPMRATTTITGAEYQDVWTPDVFYNDFSAYAPLTPTIELYGGLNNAFDRKPPRIPGAEAGGANFELGYSSGVYDVVGRTFFVGLRFHR